MTDKVVLCTGGSSGIGFHFVRNLLKHGAHIVIATSNQEHANNARKRLIEEIPNGSVDVMFLQLASLDSVRDFAEEFKSNYDRLDILCCNAGIFNQPWNVTSDGIEHHLAVNYFSHFALTALLFPLLQQTPHSRIVFTGSIYEYQAFKHQPDFDDIQWRYDLFIPELAYAASKKCILGFVTTLKEKMQRSHIDNPIVVAAHPGLSQTPIRYKISNPLKRLAYLALSRIAGQSAESGAAPLLRAATDRTVQSGDYYGPDGWQELTGRPTLVQPSANSQHTSFRKKLWSFSETVTSCSFNFSNNL